MIRSLFDIVKEDDIISLKKELGNVPFSNIKNEKNMTLLHVALLYNAGRCTEYLIERCVLFNEKDDYNNTPLQYARNYKHILMLTKKGAYL